MAHVELVGEGAEVADVVQVGADFGGNGSSGRGEARYQRKAPPADGNGAGNGQHASNGGAPKI